MERNPFEAFLSPELEKLLDEDESLDSLIRGLVITNRLSWEFNPWYHRAVNYVVHAFTPVIKNKWQADDPYEYTGIERRKTVRDALDDFLTSCKRTAAVVMMPKTKKIEHIKDVA